MRLRSQEIKLRRYFRIKRRKHGYDRAASFNRFARLYWRYHFKVYGPHLNLWNIDI